MRKRLVILGSILLSFVGLYALLTSYQSATTTTAKATAKEYQGLGLDKPRKCEDQKWGAYYKRTSDLPNRVYYANFWHIYR